MALDDTEPLWCEECKHFTDVGPDGEGRCATKNEETWYGQIACDEFKEKGNDD